MIYCPFCLSSDTVFVGYDVNHDDEAINLIRVHLCESCEQEFPVVDQLVDENGDDGDEEWGAPY